MTEMKAVYTRPPRPSRRRSLGYWVEMWIAENLVHANTGEPLILNDEQSYFLDTWYEIDDTGRFVYNRGALRRVRGAGKSPTFAIVACAELCGPVRFGGWDAYGFPIAVPDRAPWIQIFGTTIEQTKPIMDIAVASFSEEAIERYALDIGKEQIIKAGTPRGRLQVLSNSPRAIRGGRPSCVFIDENSEWVQSNGGHEAMIRITGNVVKYPGGTARILEAGNAYVPGEDSLGERTHIAWQKQVERPDRRVTILYDSIEAPPGIVLSDMQSLRLGIELAKGDAKDLDTDRLVETALDPSVSPSQFRREHLNQIVVDEDSLISAEDFGRCFSENTRPLSPADEITIGFDGALTGDDTALVAFRLGDRSFHILNHWAADPLEPEWRIDEEAVDMAVRAAFENLNVVGAAVDVHPFESWVTGWERDYGDKMLVRATSSYAIARDNRTDLRGLTFETEALLGDIEGGRVTFTNDGVMRRHWLNAKRRPNRYGTSFAKATRNSSRKIDIVAASLMAYTVARKVDLLRAEEPIVPATIRPRRW